MLKIKLFPAEYGDCVLLEINDKKTIYILVDGGTTKTYDNFIKKEIKSIKDNIKKLDLIICTHIDFDHIGGLIQTIKNTDPKMIGTVWYNGFLQVIDSRYYTNRTGKYEARDIKLLDDIIVKGTQYNGEQEIGINHGMSFEVLLKEKEIAVNSIVEGKTISTEFISNSIKITENTEIFIIGPSKENIQKLEQFWTNQMKDRGYMFQVSDEIKLMESFEYVLESIKLFYANEELKVSGSEDLEKYIGMLNETDGSVTNASSISFIIQHRKEKYLFLGDTIIDSTILENIEHIVGYKYTFKAIKLPHHGSRYNITHEFIKRYKAEEYYCLTNSKQFGHPDLEVISSLICCNSSFKRIFFNYPIDKINFLNNENLKVKYKYEIVIGTGNSPLERSFE